MKRRLARLVVSAFEIAGTQWVFIPGKGCVNIYDMLGEDE